MGSTFVGTFNQPYVAVILVRRFFCGLDDMSQRKFYQASRVGAKCFANYIISGVFNDSING